MSKLDYDLDPSASLMPVRYTCANDERKVHKRIVHCVLAI